VKRRQFITLGPRALAVFRWITPGPHSFSETGLAAASARRAVKVLTCGIGANLIKIMDVTGHKLLEM
jgi:hypothetical protein